MKLLLVLVAAAFGVSATAYAATYKWVDDKGVVNFTDNPANVPKKYLNKVKVTNPGEGQPEPEAAAPVAVPSPAPKVEAESSSRTGPFGGHDERWWRSRYAGLRGEIRALQDNLPSKREELEGLRRELAVHTYARNREAYQAKLAEIRLDETRIKDLAAELAELDIEAARAGVPFDWRQ